MPHGCTTSQPPYALSLTKLLVEALLLGPWAQDCTGHFMASWLTPVLAFTKSCEPSSNVQERRAKSIEDGGLVTYKDQLSYGVHVIVVMGVFYLLGHFLAASLSSKLSLVCSNPHTSYSMLTD